MTQDPGIQVSIALKLSSALAFGWLFKPQGLIGASALALVGALAFGRRRST